ncbi:velvet factor-domain-containing protein [Crepidotus variabilis]|uniref:Velvet factor-domain-containing protein n=1 Tax=Crepidotus variabilis TaxID=179855 RepID=A0A9P6JMI1_9AGAR|nr:velvet factor-domain-containing protein [Crepidotus variabilis]
MIDFATRFNHDLLAPRTLWSRTEDVGEQQYCQRIYLRHPRILSRDSRTPILLRHLNSKIHGPGNSQPWFALPTTVSVQASYLGRSKRRTSESLAWVKYPCSRAVACSSCPTPLAVYSSGCSSPPFTSVSHSRASSTTQSPVTSQASISDLASSSSLPFVRPQPRIQVSSLLSESNTRSYHLEIVQQPLRTAEFGTAYLSRVPITPPIIARLTVRDPSGNSVVPEAELPFLIAHLSLFSGDGTRSLDTGSYIGRGSRENPPVLYGHLVATVEQLEDLQGNMGLFFLFPDVSIRSRGCYTLGVTLTRITSQDPTGMLSEHGTALAQTRTQPFDTVAFAEYVAAPPTRLTQSFVRQGARMSLNAPR